MAKNGGLSETVIGLDGSKRLNMPNVAFTKFSIMNPAYVFKNKALNAFAHSAEFYALSVLLLEKSNVLSNDVKKINEMFAWIKIDANGSFSFEIPLNLVATYSSVRNLGTIPTAPKGGYLATIHTHPIDGLAFFDADTKSLSGLSVGRPYPSPEDVNKARDLGLPGFSVSSKGSVYGYDKYGYK